MLYFFFGGGGRCSVLLSKRKSDYLCHFAIDANLMRLNLKKYPSAPLVLTFLYGCFVNTFILHHEKHGMSYFRWLSLNFLFRVVSNLEGNMK